VTGQTGFYNDRRVTLDAGQAINHDFAARLNLMYEKSDTFRDFTKLERYGNQPDPDVAAPQQPRSSSATNIITMIARRTAAIPRKEPAPRRRHRPASTRPPRSRRQATSRPSSAARA